MMRTTLEIEQSSYRLAKALATQRGVSLGAIVSEAIRSTYGESTEQSVELRRSSAGFPCLTLGRSITAEDVAPLEDELSHSPRCKSSDCFIVHGPHSP